MSAGRTNLFSIFLQFATKSQAEFHVKKMVNLTIIAGGYTSFIVSYLFNPDASSLTLLSNSSTGTNPSWIASHPTNSSILYATNEVDVGLLQSFLVDSQGGLTNIANASSGGNGPAFTAPLSTGEVAIMNFGSGDGRFIPTNSDDPLTFNDSTAGVITFPANVSNPHMAVEHDNEVFVPDLGADKIWRLVQDSPGSYHIVGSIDQPPKSGPRHIAILNNTLYTLHETASTLTQQEIPFDPTATAPIIVSTSITPPNPPPQATFAAAEILLTPPSPSFPSPYIYVSNRNIGPTPDPNGDTIAIFQVEPELKLVKHVFTGLQQIRGMMFGGEENEFLVASGNVGEAGVMVFKRTNEGQDLEFVAENTDVPTRSSFVWIPSSGDL